jgi:hypothetical protein
VPLARLVAGRASASGATGNRIQYPAAPQRVGRSPRDRVGPRYTAKIAGGSDLGRGPVPVPTLPISESAQLPRGNSGSIPHPFEVPGRNARVSARVLRVAVTEPILDQTEVLSLVCQGVAAGVPKHVRVDVA